jgi:hypothetical protein
MKRTLSRTEKHRYQRLDKIVRVDCSSNTFLARMTHEALKEDAPYQYLLAVIRYMASTDDKVR